MPSKSHPSQEATDYNKQEKLKKLVCPQCDRSDFSNFNALSQHFNRMHDGPIAPDVRLESKQTCKRLYHQRGLSLAEMGDLMDTSQQTVSKWLDKHDIETDTKYGEQEKSDLLHDFEWLWTQRWVNQKNEREIASELDVTYRGVGYWLKKYNIRGRVHPYIDDPEILHDLYIRRDWSLKELTDEFNVHKSTVSKKARQAGFSKKVHRTNAWGLRWAIPYIREQYMKEKKTLEQIASDLDIGSVDSVVYMMDRFDIDRRDRTKQWKGAAPTGHYDGEWMKAREKARSRDGYNCQRCGVSEDELNRELDVHHKVPYRIFDDPKKANELDNLVSLCNRCHPIVEAWSLIPEHE
ncbi:nuclease [Haloquadratum phage sp.]|nr:nuclease [Haloquadratum phage sp.]